MCCCLVVELAQCLEDEQRFEEQYQTWKSQFYDWKEQNKGWWFTFELYMQSVNYLAHY